MNLQEFVYQVKTAENITDIEKYQKDILSLFPKSAIMLHFDQKNHAHQYNLWEHSLHVVCGLPKDISDDMLYIAAFLHDIGKPDCQCRGTNPEDTGVHYYGHPVRSMEIVRDEVIPELERQGEILSEDDKRRLLYYVEYHDDRMSLRIKHLRRHLRMVSFEEFRNLVQLQLSDAKAHVMKPIIEERIRVMTEWAGDYGKERYQDILNGK